MTDIAVRPSTTPTLARPTNTPRQLATMALAAEDGTLKTARAVREACTLFREARNPPEGIQDRRQWARERLPALPALEALLRDVKAAHAAPADPAQNRVFVSLMVESYPSAKDIDRGPAIEAMLHDLHEEGYPPAAVAEGLKSLRRTSKFLPSISEVLTAVSNASAQLYQRISSVQCLIHERERLA